MSRIKRIASLCLAVVMVFTFFGCVKTQKESLAASVVAKDYGAFKFKDDGIYSKLLPNSATITPWSPSSANTTGSSTPYFDLGYMIQHGDATYYRMPVSSEATYIGISVTTVFDKTVDAYKIYDVGSYYKDAATVNSKCQFPDVVLYRGTGTGLTADACKTKISDLTGKCSNVTISQAPNSDTVRFDFVVPDTTAATYNYKNFSYVFKDSTGKTAKTSIMNYTSSPTKPSNIELKYYPKKGRIGFSFKNRATSSTSLASDVVNGLICIKSKKSFTQASIQEYLYTRTKFTKEYVTSHGTKSTYAFNFDPNYRYYVMVFPAVYNMNIPFFNDLYGVYPTITVGSADCYRVMASSANKSKVVYKKIGTVYMGKFRPVK